MGRGRGRGEKGVGQGGESKQKKKIRKVSLHTNLWPILSELKK